jgi:hypothetical protein
MALRAASRLPQGKGLELTIAMIAEQGANEEDA